MFDYSSKASVKMVILHQSSHFSSVLFELCWIKHQTFRPRLHKPSCKQEINTAIQETQMDLLGLVSTHLVFWTRDMTQARSIFYPCCILTITSHQMDFPGDLTNTSNSPFLKFSSSCLQNWATSFSFPRFMDRFITNIATGSQQVLYLTRIQVNLFSKHLL